MAKPLKFYQTLNQPPRNAKHGQHRRTSPPAYGSPAVGAYHSAGGADPDAWVAWDFARPEPKPPAIPYAGIRTGEIIGHRLWWIIDGHLCSLAHRRLWLPGETIKGDIRAIIIPDIWRPILGGTYAFAGVAQCEVEKAFILVELNEFGANPHLRFLGWAPYYETRTFVVGTIKMWGDVVEHERGYRAEFAKLNSIDELFGEGDLAQLRQRYGVALISSERGKP